MESRSNESAQKARLIANDDSDNLIVLVPIENLDIANNTMKIGSVKFFRLTNKYIGKIVANLEWHSAKKQLLKARKRDRLLQTVKPWIDNIWAEVPIVGNPKELFGVSNDALNRIDEALNVVRLYRYWNDDFYGRYFGIPGSVVSLGVGLASCLTRLIRVGPMAAIRTAVVSS